MVEVTVSQKGVDFANVFKAFIGSSFLSMPFAFHQSGIIFGVLMLLLIGWLTDHCCCKIVRCKAIIISRLMDKFEVELNNGLLTSAEAELFQSGKLKSRWENRMTLSHIAKYAYGKKAQWVVSVCLFISQFGFCTGYFVFIGNTLKELFPANGSYHGNTTSSPTFVSYNIPLIYLVMTPLPIFVLSSLLRSVRNIGWISSVATATVTFGFFTVLGLLLHGFTVDPNFYYVKFATLPIVFGLLTCGFEGIGTVIPIESSMIGNRHNFSPYLHVSMILMIFILGSFGVLGHLRYGEDTKQIVLQNIPSTVFVAVVNCVLIVNVLCTYPLQMFPVTEIAEFLFFRKTSSDYEKERVNIMNEEPRSDVEELLADLNDDESTVDEQTVQKRIPYFQTVSMPIQRVDIPNYGSNYTEENDPSGISRYDAISTNSDSVFTKKEKRMMKIIHGSKITASTWKRNLVRFLLVLLQMGLAVAMRDKYAYLNAFIGAIGSSFLAYILPAATYYKLSKGTDERRFRGCGDILIVIFGIVGSVTSFVATVLDTIR